MDDNTKFFYWAIIIGLIVIFCQTHGLPSKNTVYESKDDVLYEIEELKNELDSIKESIGVTDSDVFSLNESNLEIANYSEQIFDDVEKILEILDENNIKDKENKVPDGPQVRLENTDD